MDVALHQHLARPESRSATAPPRCSTPAPQVVFTGADTPAVADVAQEKGKWGVTYDHPGSCKVDACLTAPYWIWGPEYARIAEQVKAGTYKAGYEYFDADSKAMGLFGFMDGETPAAGRRRPAGRGRPEGQGHAGQDAGRHVRPVRRLRRADQRQHRQGAPRRPAPKLEQSDLDQFPPGAPGTECKTCMYWWNEGITSELPPLVVGHDRAGGGPAARHARRGPMPRTPAGTVT